MGAEKKQVSADQVEEPELLYTQAQKRSLQSGELEYMQPFIHADAEKKFASGARAKSKFVRALHKIPSMQLAAPYSFWNESSQIMTHR